MCGVEFPGAETSLPPRTCGLLSEVDPLSRTRGHRRGGTWSCLDTRRGVCVCVCHPVFMFLCSLGADVFQMFNRQNTDSPLLHVCFHLNVFILFLCCPVVITQSIVVW